MNLEQSLGLDSGNRTFDMIEDAVMRAVANTTGYCIRNLKPDDDGAAYEIHVPYRESWLMAWGTLDYQTARHTPEHLYIAKVEEWLTSHRDKLVDMWEHPERQPCIDMTTGKEVDCE